MQDWNTKMYEFRELCNLNEETKDGYFISSDMKKVWNVELNILSYLLKVCSEYGLKVIVDSGTLIGAVRHKGFIPWDDDIDVLMPREDYDKLIEIGSKEFKDPFVFQSFLVDNDCVFGYSKIKCNGTCFMSNDDRAEKNKGHFGIFIDIFPYDILPENKDEMLNFVRLEKYILNFMKFRVNLIDKLRKYEYYLKIKESYPEFVNYSNKELYQQYHDNILKYKNASNTGGHIFINQRPEEICTFDKSYFDDIVLMPFEKIMVPVPRSYDVILTNYYGDWKTPIKYQRNVNEKKINSECIYDATKSYKEYQLNPFIFFLVKNSRVLKLLWKVYYDLLVNRFYEKKLNFLISKKYSNKSVVLWGASVFLQKFSKRYGLVFDNVVGIVDKVGALKGKTLGDKKIYGLEQLRDIRPDIILVTIINGKKNRLKEINEYLEKNGLKLKVEIL